MWTTAFPRPPGPRPSRRADGYRRELTAHCYRMTGSIHDAEDLVQETYLRAWRAYEGFEGRSSVRTWLYRIATNVCLTALEGKDRRPLRPGSARRRATRATGSWSRPRCPGWSRCPTPSWPASERPGRIVGERESIRLAFVAALQHLPARQRAVLILRDVLRWKAAEVAEALETSEAAVNSALQRAHAQLPRPNVSQDTVGRRSTPSSRSCSTATSKAFWDKDIDAIVGMLDRRRGLGDAAVHRVVLRCREHRPAHRHPVPRGASTTCRWWRPGERPARVRPLHAPARRHVHAVPPPGAHPRGAGEVQPRRRVLRRRRCSRSSACRRSLPAGYDTGPREAADVLPRPVTAGRRGAVELLDRAVGYTRGMPGQVTEADLDRPRPARGWALRDLLVHMDDSLEAMAEAAGGDPALEPARPCPVDAGAPSCSTASANGPAACVAQWIPPGGPVVRLGRPEPRPRELLGAVGALEITLHGVGRRPSRSAGPADPAGLAMDLWPFARDHITDADRPVRFG